MHRPVIVAPAANRKHLVIYPIYEFNGTRYRSRRDKYYYSGQGEALHRAVWEHNFGPIPPKHHVHHKDNNPSNNNPENLECMPGRNHHQYHMNEPNRVKLSKRFIPAAIAAAARKRRANPAWSRAISSIAGKASQAARAVWPKQSFTCAHCGKKYQARPINRKKGKSCCSSACWYAARYASGIDNESRICVECGIQYRINKYRTNMFCSRGCAGKHRSKT